MKTTRNIFASYGASAVSVVVALLATPAYIYFLGIEAYALTGFLVTLQTWFAVLDFGLSPALSRSVTQFAAGRRDEAWIGSIFRAMERIFLIAACVIATVVAFSAPWADTTRTLRR